MEDYSYHAPAVYVRNADGEYNITQMLASIKWSGDVDTVCRSLEFEMIVSATDPTLPYVYLPLGGAVWMEVDGARVFVGNVISKDKSTDSNTMTVLCYDKGFYLKRSKATRKYDGTSPEALTEELCKTYGVGIKSLAQTGYSVKRKFSATAIYQIIDTAYTLAARENGKKYMLRFDGADLNVLERGVTPASVILSAKTNIQVASYSEGIENMVNRVWIVDEDGNQMQVISDDTAVQKYGLLADVIQHSDKKDAASEANELLEDNGVERKISVNCLGHPKLLTGNTVWTHEPFTGQAHTCWIDGDTHTWKNGLYLSKVKLNRKNEMRKSESGSEVE